VKKRLSFRQAASSESCSNSLLRCFAASLSRQRSTIVSGRLSQGILDVRFGEFVVALPAADEFAAQRREAVAMPTQACLNQTLVQQVQQERHERLNDLLAREDVCGLDAPG